MIIGLTGMNSSGKDAVAEYLVRKKGFIHCSLSDELRKELRLRGIIPSRENLIKVGTDLRRKNDNAELARRVSKNIKKGKNYVVTSIRHPAEIIELKKNKDFLLADVFAPAKIRFERMLKRARPGDPETFKEFLELEKKESKTRGPGQQLVKCSKMAQLVIENGENSKRSLNSKIEKFLRKAACLRNISKV
jgi:dephospho-CoA kinase